MPWRLFRSGSVKMHPEPGPPREPPGLPDDPIGRPSEDARLVIGDEVVVPPPVVAGIQGIVPQVYLAAVQHVVSRDGVLRAQLDKDANATISGQRIVPNRVAVAVPP